MQSIQAFLSGYDLVFVPKPSIISFGLALSYHVFCAEIFNSNSGEDFDAGFHSVKPYSPIAARQDSKGASLAAPSVPFLMPTPTPSEGSGLIKNDSK